jgi:FMN-dependent NADH-azoreductase
MSLFRLDASIRVTGSHSRALADLVEQGWMHSHPEERIVRRNVGMEPLPSTAWASAVWASRTPSESRTEEQEFALNLPALLTDELLGADEMLFAIPLFNFGVSEHFKTWVDLVITDPRMSAGRDPLLKGTPAVLVTVRGGVYGAGTPREGWDHATGWYRRILADVWRLDLDVVEEELTNFGVNPALDRFEDLALRTRREAEELARRLGSELGASRQRASIG